MTFKPGLWQPIAFVLSAVNLVAVGFAAGAAEPAHSALHAGLALAFGVWAERLGRHRSRGAIGAIGGEVDARLEAFEAELDDLRRELSETQERVDFAERMLAQAPEPRRVGPEG